MRTKHYFSLLLVFCLFASNSFAQSFTDNTTASISNEPETHHYVTVGMFGLGYGIEHKFNSKFYLMGTVGLTPSLGYYHTNGVGRFFYSLSPQITAEGRYYYNLEKRLRQGQSIKANSGSFFGMGVSYTFKPLLEKNIQHNADVLDLSSYWGLRRLLNPNLIVEWKVGLGLSYFNSINKFDWFPMLGVGLKYRFS